MYSAYDFNDIHFDICLPSFAFKQTLGAFGVELYGIYTIIYILLYITTYYISIHYFMELYTIIFLLLNCIYFT